ncbi:cobalamin-binding protein [Deltaproteobacteria bacterium Smac51]|nr:cobalamin-binding protein [Deltaproteobacteria bacterium Smac51]
MGGGYLYLIYVFTLQRISMSEKATLEKLSRTLVELDDECCVSITSELLEQGIEPIEILSCCEKALAVIGEKYAAGEYYIAGLIMAGELMSQITDEVTPWLPHSQVRGSRGRVLIGTIQGDIHGLGKNIAGALLSAHGFEVKDLGVDVPLCDFIKECEVFQPDVVGLSVLLSTCFPSLGETVAGLRTVRGGKVKPYIFITGAQVRDEHRQQYGADFNVITAFDTVRLCEKLVPPAA